MTPIHELLARARWDPMFGAARFVIGYEDHLAGGLVRVPLERIRFTPGGHFAFELQAEDGKSHAVPYHRVRDLWRDGVLIWHRPSPRN